VHVEFVDHVDALDRNPGGAGPVHAASYAANVGVRRIVVPFFATVHSAYGAARSDVRFSLRHSHPVVLPVDPAVVEAIYAKMESDGASRLAEADVPHAQQRHERWVEARYRRQVHHLRVPAPSPVDAAGLRKLMGDFEHEYERLFGRGAALKDAGIELVNYGVDSIGTDRKSVV
jgi:N-methylhydantoinase A